MLYTVDLDGLRLVSAVVLEPHDFGDIGVDPVDGRLYSVSDSGELVRVDRSTGRIEPVRGIPGLPADHYGSLVVGPGREVYVAGHRRGIYRVERDGSVTRLGEGPSTTASDMAGCLASPPEPPTPTPPEPPEPTPTESPRPPRPTPTPARTATSSPSAPPTPTTTATRTPSPPTASSPEDARAGLEPAPSASAEPSSESDAEAEGTGHSTEEKRRWAVATLVMIIGGSIAVRRVR